MPVALAVDCSRASAGRKPSVQPNPIEDDIPGRDEQTETLVCVNLVDALYCN